MTRAGRSNERHGMRSRKDLQYFRDRAEQELGRAERADHPDAARAHYQLAGYYLDLVHNCGVIASDEGEIRRTSS